MTRNDVRLPGDALIELRLRLGASQAAVAERMGVSRQRVANLERESRVAPGAAARYVGALEAILAERDEGAHP